MFFSDVQNFTEYVEAGFVTPSPGSTHTEFMTNLNYRTRSRVAMTQTLTDLRDIRAENQTAIVDMWTEEFRRRPENDQLHIIFHHQRLREKAKAKFEKSGNESEKITGEIHLRAAESFRNVLGQTE